LKKVIFFILVVALGGAGYYFFGDYLVKRNIDLWGLVPNHALIVYESSALPNNYNETLETEVGKSLLQLASIKQFNEFISGLDSTDTEKGIVGRLFRGETIISLHVVAKNTFGTTIYKNIAQSDEKASFLKVIDRFEAKNQYSIATRKYQGKDIYELVNSETGAVFSYFLEENVVVGSFTPFLVEDVIRIIDRQEKGFKESNKAIFELPRLSNDKGNVYVNTHKFNQFISALGGINSGQVIKDLGTASFLDLNIDNKGLYLNGFTEFEQTNFLSVFNDQQPVASDLKYLVPNNSASILQLGFNNRNTFFSQISDFFDINQEEVDPTFYEKYNLKAELGADWVDDNIGLVQLERELGHLFYLKTTDVNEALNDLNTLGESVAVALGDSVYAERYSDYEIRELMVENYTRNKFLPLLPKADLTYYTAVEDYIVFSNTIQNLKDLTGSIENEDTWGRSVTYNSFLDRTLEEFNFSFTVNTERFLEGAQSQMEGSWRESVKENLPILSNFYLASFQLSKLDDNFYTSVVVGHNRKKEVVKQNFAIAQEVSLQSLVNSKPYVVKNHISNLREVVVLDSANSLKLISNGGDVLWSKDLPGKIVGELEQVDYYKNGKLQYFFTTANHLHIIDRNGNYIEGFPKQVNDNIAYSTVVDYDNSKRYRFLIADDRGNIYLYNKEGDSLDGWNPRKLEGILTTTPFHLRVRKKDCFVTVLSNGQVVLLNRQGVALKGFPLDLEARLTTGVDVKKGSDLSSTIFTTITKEGRMIQFNMEGQILETEQLYKPTKESEFRVISDALGKSFIVIRKDLNRIVVLDEKGNELFAKDYLDADDMAVQYYDFSTSNKLYAITDKIQGFTYLYDADGRLINTRPVDSEFEVGVIYSEVRDDLKVYAVSGNTFKILQFN